MPELSRSLLMYRYRRLDGRARPRRTPAIAGAMYPWQSGSDGREESQSLHLNPQSGRWKPDNTHLQRHVGLAIAYNVWQYIQTTGDLEFLRYYGASCWWRSRRFFSSLATYDQVTDRYLTCAA